MCFSVTAAVLPQREQDQSKILFFVVFNLVQLAFHRHFSNVLRAAGCPRLAGGDDGLDVDVVMADLTRVDVDPAGLSKGQEGAEAQQVHCGDKGKYSRPRACGLNEVPREIHHQDP